MHGIWFVDNIAALTSLIRGRSNNEELDSMAGAAHGLLFEALATLNGYRARITGQTASADKEPKTLGSNGMGSRSFTPTPCSCSQAECQMSDDACDVGRFSNQSTQVQTVQT